MTTAGGVLSVGAIEVTSARSSANLIVGNSGSVNSGVLQLNGATVNGVANTILRNAGAGTTILVITNGFGTAPLFPMGLSNTLAGGVVDASSPIVIYSLITGSGFTKIGSGTLTLTTSNLYSGNTTISNGVFQLTDNAYLNNSTIVMGGGILERASQANTFIPRRNNAYLSPVSITGNSTMRTTTTSTRTIHFEAPFSGVAGTTLLLTNTGTLGTNHFRLYAGGISYAGNITLGANGTANRTFLELFNTNNPAGGSDDVFTGLIKGGGVVYKNIDVNPGGNVIFSNANSYTGGTELRAGFFGLGANNCLGTGNILVGSDPNPIGLYAVDVARTLTNDIYVDVNSGSLSTSVGCTNLQIKGSKNLTLSGRILIHTNFTQFIISNTAVTTFAGGVTNAAAGSLGIVKQGSGKLLLSGVNTFNGSVIVANGTLGFSGNAALVNATNLTLWGGTTLDVSGMSHTLTLSNSQPLQLANLNGTNVTIICGSSSGLTLSPPNSFVFPYADGVPVIKVGGGPLTLNGGAISLVVTDSVPWAEGSHLLIDTFSGGTVTGTLPAFVNITGPSFPSRAFGVPSLVGGKLYVNYQKFFSAYDTGAGFFSGDENLVHDDFSGRTFAVWSTTNLSLPVSNWTAEASPVEFPISGSSPAMSHYGITVTPSASPTYYVFATTNAGPYSATEPVIVLTTADYVDFMVVPTNAYVSAGGVFSFIPPPVITVQPASVSKLKGQTAQFNVTATGAGLSYQWYYNGGGLGGATSAGLTLPNVTSANAGNYMVTVVNGSGVVTSSVAGLTVRLPPEVTAVYTNGGFVLGGLSVAGLVYVVETATNLSAPVWTPVFTNTTAGGAINYQPSTSTDPSQFYRIAFP